MTQPPAPPRSCRLDKLEGRIVACPEGRCAFWEPGGAVLPGRCVLDGIDFARERDLAEFLVEVRDGIEYVHDHSQPAHR